MQRYVTDIRGFSGRGDSFPEHKRHIPMVLMIVLKYLMGQFFFLMARFRAVNTFAHHERCEAKGLNDAYYVMYVTTVGMHRLQ